MRTTLTILLSALLFAMYPTISCSQLEGANWYFGTFAGMEFSTGNPLPDFNGQLSTGEGCASVSDKDGNLLFYTDGITVYDRNHDVMPNGTGLLGNPSSVQSAIVCPKPGTWNPAQNHFDGYIIGTVDFLNGTNGVRWSEVDMTANGGNGDVVAATKNTHLIGTTTVEGANFAKHENGCDYWFLTKEVGNDTWRAFPVTNMGVENTPVVSNTGPNTPAAWGTIKASPNSEIVALSNSNAGVHVYDFDKATGQLLHRYEDNIGGHYSLEFSPDGRFLYYVCLNNPDIHQLDLTTATQADFIASKVVVGSTTNTAHNYRLGALQLAPDGKIYLALIYTTFVGVINNPNLQGAAANYTDFAVDIGGTNVNGSATEVVLGLPSFPTFFMQEPKFIIPTQYCNSQDVNFLLSDYEDLYNQYWHVTETGDDFSATPDSPDSSFTTTLDPGIYDVKVILDYGCFLDSIIQTVEVIPPPDTLDLGNDTCFIEPFTLDAGSGYDFYEWHDGSTDETFEVTGPGTYSCEIGVIGNNLIYNGDFEDGNIGFTSQYIYSSGTITQGGYTVDTDITNGWWPNCPDHTTGSGNMLISDATCPDSGVPQGADFWCQTVQVQPNTDYLFTVWTANGNDNDNEAEFGFYFNGVQEGGPVTSEPGSCNWTEHTLIWNSGALTSVDICIQELTYVCSGADFIMDDISLSPICYQTDTIEVHQTPQADFSYTQVCANEVTDFTDESTIDAPYTITGYEWDILENGIINYTSENPAHTFNDGGTYDVALTIETDVGCRDSLTLPVEVNPLPEVDFEFDNTCVEIPVLFSDLSSIGSGTIDVWNWDFDDGNTDNIQNPEHTFTTAGEFDVNLEITSDLGCTSELTQTILIYPAAEASFNVEDACFYDDLVFTNESTNSTDSEWDFGDNIGTSSEENPVYNYDDPGEYTVSLIVTSADGCKDTTQVIATAYPQPDPDFDFTNVCFGEENEFSDNSEIEPPDVIETHAWDFGDQNTTTGAVVTHEYTGEGNYDVTLTVTSANGCSNSVTKEVVVYPLPIADFDAPAVCLENPTDFADNSSVSNDFTNNSIVDYNWDFGDGSPENSNQNPQYTYQEDSTFQVTLIVTTNNGCSDTLIQEVVVHPLPEVNFVVSEINGCSPLCVDFTDNSTINTGQNEEYIWDIDGSEMTTTNPELSFCFENNEFLYAQSHDIGLTVVSDNNCSSSITNFDMIDVYPNPRADFSYDPEGGATTLDPRFKFYNTSIGAVSYSWDFSGLGTSGEENPEFVFSDQEEGRYTISLAISNQYGCKDTVYRTVVVEEELFVYVPNAFTPDGDGINDLFGPVVQGHDIKDFTFMIFNRWGELIFESHNIDSWWDGRYNGTLAQQDVYVWKLVLKRGSNTEKKQYMGHVTLLR